MEITAAWVRGQRFADVLKLAEDIFEGSLVRALRRTEELMGQVRRLDTGCCAVQYSSLFVFSAAASKAASAVACLCSLCACSGLLAVPFTRMCLDWLCAGGTGAAWRG
jgi:hypothetical protein